MLNRGLSGIPAREFPRQASEWIDDEGRRNFLKIMGASLALAGLSACTKQPTEFTMPYVQEPEQMVTGKPLYYATAFPVSGIANPILVETHEFRPTKVEGNPQHPASMGAADVATQASILGLYDPDRLQTVDVYRRNSLLHFVSFVFCRRFGKTAREERRGHPHSDGNHHVADAVLADAGRSEALSRSQMAPVGTHRPWPTNGFADGVRPVLKPCLSLRSGRRSAFNRRQLSSATGPVACGIRAILQRNARYATPLPDTTGSMRLNPRRITPAPERTIAFR